MIKTFRSRQLERYWTKGDARGLPADHLKRVRLRLTALENAAAPEEMNVPGWHFHRLTGAMRGRYSVRVTGNWRLTFAWDDNGAAAIDVDYEDYH
jgi:proteic killer suppression protein